MLPLEKKDQIVDALTRSLFSLAEPWQGRFLKWVANTATNWHWNGRPPTPDEVKGWLLTYHELYRQVKTLLNAWQGGGGDIS